MRASRAEVDKRCLASMKAEGVIPTGAPPPASDCPEEGQSQSTQMSSLNAARPGFASAYSKQVKKGQHLVGQRIHGSTLGAMLGVRGVICTTP